MSFLDFVTNPFGTNPGGTQSAWNPLTGTKSGIQGPLRATGLSHPDTPAATTASDIYAALTREQWENYVNTFVPIENQLIAFATDDTQPAQAATAARANVNNAFDVQAGDQQRRLKSLGVTLDGQEQAASTRQSGIARSLATVQGQNLAMDLTRQRQMGILGNPAPTAGSIAQQASGLSV